MKKWYNTKKNLATFITKKSSQTTPLSHTLPSHHHFTFFSSLSSINLSHLSLSPWLSLSHLSLMEKNNNKRHEQPTNSVRRSLKRKLEDDFIIDRKLTSSDDFTSQQDLVSEVRAQVEILDSTFSSIESDRALVKRSIHILSELAKNGTVVEFMNFCLILFVIRCWFRFLQLWMVYF